MDSKYWNLSAWALELVGISLRINWPLLWNYSAKRGVFSGTLVYGTGEGGPGQEGLGLVAVTPGISRPLVELVGMSLRNNRPLLLWN